jgi:2-dehydropantoate 2-reductase
MIRVVLFGTGAMSCLFAAHLSQVAGVTMMGTWTDAIAEIRERGILFEDADGSRVIRVQTESLGTSIEPADLAIVLVKAWQTEQVAAHIDRYLNPKGLAITLQNGLGNLELLGPKTFPGATSEGATLLGPGHVRAGGHGPTHVVAPDWVVQLLRSAGFESYQCSSTEAEGLLWGKLSISCGINALTALLRISNGELLKRPTAKDLMIRASIECANVAQAKAIKLPFTDPAARVTEVAERTAMNKSSMLQDVLRGAPTECDAINGAVVEEGKRLNIPTPVNEMLWHLVRAAVHQDRSDSA